MAAETQITCPHCGVTQGGTQFCAECGGALPKAGEAASKAGAETPAATAAGDVAAPKPADKPSDAKPNLARTMMGVSAEQLFGKGGAAAPKPPSGATPQGAFGAPGAAKAPSAAASTGAATTTGASTIAGMAGPLTAAAAPAPAPAAKPVEPTPEPAPAAAAPPDAAASGSGDQSALTAAEAFAAERPRRSLSKTMMGISPETLGALRASEALKQPAPAAPSAAQPAPPAVPATQPAAAGRANPMARTMLGMSPLGATPPAASQPEKLPFDASTGTMQGLPPVVDPSAHLGRGGVMAKTMLGMAPPNAKGAQPAAAGVPAPSQAQGPGSPAALGGRTMLGVPHGEGSEGAGPELRRDAVRAATSARAAAETERVPTAPPIRSDNERATLPPRREVKALWPLMAVTLVVVTLTLFLVLPSSRPAHVDVSAKIVSTETGEALLFEVPSAVAGSRIRFGGQEKPLEAGRASFALAADSLRVGDNLVLADVVRPESEPAPVRITLAVSYRIWVDTAALRAERSSLDVVITALPGTRVTLEGEELKLDEAGRGVRSYPVDVVSEAKSGVIDHVVHYRVQPPSGETVVDELRTRIPVAMMQIDRPGREVVTDRDSIEIAGAAGKDTQVHLDKLQLPVKDGRFLHRLMLPEPGEYKPRLVASATGKAPFGVQLSIRRVKDLNQAAAQFGATPDLNYAKLAPNPAIYRGQKISLEGRVYAVDPRGADSVIQMFVRPCPSSRRCPLWVSDPHGTEVNVDAWIKVLGVVQGEQQFRSEKNEIVTVPKVEAQFVLPAAP